MQDDDKQLVKAARNGKETAIATLYDRYAAAIYRFCYYQLGDSEQAADLMQDVFIEMIHSLKSFNFQGSFKNWLYTIAKRQVLKTIRAKYQYPKTTLGDWIAGSDDSDWLDPDRSQTLKRRRVKQLLAQLSPAEAKIVTLTHLQGYSSKEAAAVTGKTPESIRVIVHRALKKLALWTRKT